MTPEQLKKSGYDLDDDERFVASEEMQEIHFIPDLQLDRPPEKYFLAGRRARGVKHGHSFGIAIESSH
jgi:hypothetical protein